MHTYHEIPKITSTLCRTSKSENESLERKNL